MIKIMIKKGYLKFNVGRLMFNVSSGYAGLGVRLGVLALK